MYKKYNNDDLQEERRKKEQGKMNHYEIAQRSYGTED